MLDLASTLVIVVGVLGVSAALAELRRKPAPVPVRVKPNRRR